MNDPHQDVRLKLRAASAALDDACRRRFLDLETESLIEGALREALAALENKPTPTSGVEEITLGMISMDVYERFNVRPPPWVPNGITPDDVWGLCRGMQEIIDGKGWQVVKK